MLISRRTEGAPTSVQLLLPGKACGCTNTTLRYSDNIRLPYQPPSEGTRLFIQVTVVGVLCGAGLIQSQQFAGNVPTSPILVPTQCPGLRF